MVYCLMYCPRLNEVPVSVVVALWLWDLSSSSLVSILAWLCMKHTKKKLILIRWLVYILSGFVFLLFVPSHDARFMVAETHTSNHFSFAFPVIISSDQLTASLKGKQKPITFADKR